MREFLRERNPRERFKIEKKKAKKIRDREKELASRKIGLKSKKKMSKGRKTEFRKFLLLF